MPFDPNKLYEVEMTTVLRVNFAPDHFKPVRSKLNCCYIKNALNLKIIKKVIQKLPNTLETSNLDLNIVIKINFNFLYQKL